MFPSGIARRWLIFLLAVLGVVAPSILSQELRLREIDAHLQRAFEEVVRERVDEATLARVQERFQDIAERGSTGVEASSPVENAFYAVEEAFSPASSLGRGSRVPVPARTAIPRVEEASSSRDGTLDKAQATKSIAAAIRKDFGLTHGRNGFQVLRHPPEHLTRERALRTSSDFVDAISSVIRRLDILEEIGPVESKESLNHDQLRAYLRDRMGVTDYLTVTDSFHPALMTDVVTFKKPTNLLRLYGGQSKATGRYFFCCLRSTKGSDLGSVRFWSDASGLATPPKNLLDHLAVATIPAGTTAVIGTVADNFPEHSGRLAKGGNAQIFIPEIETFPFQHYRLAAEEDPVTEIALESDDRILWFRLKKD